ncbi:MAG: hypothetical protein AAFO69_10785 [Bacteroidota bacterium]
MMQQFNFKRRTHWSGPHLTGLLLLLAGVAICASPMYMTTLTPLKDLLSVGIAAIAIGLLIMFTYSGTLIDFTNGRVKEYQSIAGLKIGQWSNLPAVHTVRVVSVNSHHSNVSNGVSPTFSGTVTEFKVVLYQDSHLPSYTFTYAKEEIALKDAKVLASMLSATLETQLA